jgi:hypothetical protein
VGFSPCYALPRIESDFPPFFRRQLSPAENADQAAVLKGHAFTRAANADQAAVSNGHDFTRRGKRKDSLVPHKSIAL